MWEYTGKVLDHFRNPRNVGAIESPDGLGEAGSMACGDALKLTFKLNSEGRIEEARFQTFGCASAIASSSALTEMIKGMTLEDAAKVTNQDVADYLGGLPEQKMHCSVLAREALDLAIDNYRTGKTGKKMLEGKVVCHCFGVTEEEIERIVRNNNLDTVEEVTNYCKAGGACGKCHDDIAAIIARINGQKVATVMSPPEKMTMVRKIKLIEEIMNREIRPVLKKDGGDIELVDVVENRVLVTLRGMCANCQVARFTLKDVVEAKLREFVTPDLVVEETTK